VLLGGILGLVGAVIPELIKIYKDRQNHKHEIEILELQLKYQRELISLRLEEAKVFSSIELDKKVYDFAAPTEPKITGKTWLDALQIFSNIFIQSVRPAVTYLLILFWLLMKIAMWKGAGGTLEAIPLIWSDAENEFISAVITFWFGGRAFARTFGRS